VNRTSFSFFWLLAAALFAPAQGATIRNIAGTGVRGYSGDGGPALQAQFNEPSGLARGPDGALYVCDTGNDRIRRIAPDGIVTTFAGTGEKGWKGDGGPASSAQLNEPWEIRFDGAGNAVWVERLNHVVRERERLTGIVRTIAGSGLAGFSGDGGPATQARFNQPHSIAFDSAGDLFICDISNNRVRKVDRRTGIVTTIAGTGQKKPTTDGAALAGTPLSGPRAIAFDRDGDLWLVLREGNAVLKLDLARGVIHRIAGTGAHGFSGDGGPAARATFSGPKGISLAPNGDIYLADTENHAIRRIDPTTGQIARVAGTGVKGDGPVGDPLACRLTRPHGILAEADGCVYIGDTDGNRVRVVTPR
jgi:DNA-binding beta-propeller fold protein YncE